MKGKKMKPHKYLMISLLLLVFIGSSRAQLMQKKTLTLEGAKKIVAEAVAYAKKNNAPGGAIAVVDDGGNLMYLERLDNTFAAGANVSIGKARTAAIFKKSTGFFEKIIREGRTPMVALNDFTPLQGGVPIEIEGQIVGAIGVSGAASAQQDEEIALAGAEAAKTLTAAMKTGSTSPSSGVVYFKNDKVASAFIKGQPLIEINNYKVHASHREAPGMAEIHEKDTDIVYVLEGTATFVTGGSAVDAKTVAPEEIRGSSISKGETYKLSKGDVVIVPNGVPHWFKDVSVPFNYYVVKVREAEGVDMAAK